MSNIWYTLPLQDVYKRQLTGPVATVDAFYAPEDLNKRLALREGGILCIEMEADAEFIIGLYRGFRCGAAFVLDNGPRTDKKVSVKSGESTDFAVAHHGKDPVYVESEMCIRDRVPSLYPVYLLRIQGNSFLNLKLGAWA